MKSLSGNSMSTLNVAGHVSFQASKYAGVSSIRPSLLSTIYILSCFSSSIASPLYCISVKFVGKVLLKPLFSIASTLHLHWTLGSENDGLQEEPVPVS